MNTETPQSCDNENKIKTSIILVNSLIILAQIIIILLDSLSPYNLTLLILVVLIVICQSLSFYFSKMRSLKFIYLQSFLLAIISVEIQIDSLFLIFQQLAIFDILFICKWQTKIIFKNILLIADIILNTYVFIRVWLQHPSSTLLIFAILQQILLKMLLLHFKAMEHKKSEQLSSETQKLNHQEIELINEKSVPRAINQDTDELNSSKLFKAFDFLPEGIIIMDKRDKDLFQIRYSNGAAQLLLDTNQHEEMLLELLHLKGASSSKSDEHIYKYSFSYQSQQSVKKNSFKVIPKQQQLMKASYKLSQQFIIENQNYLSQNIIQQQSSHECGFTFPPVQIFFPNSSVKYDSLNHPNSPSINYASSGRKHTIEEFDLFSNLLHSIWGQLLLMIKEKSQSSLLNQPLNYIHESDVFVADVKKYQRKQCLDLKVFSALHEQQPLLIILVRDINHKSYIKLLQDHNSQKSKTLSFVSHEFRTPLNCIISMLESVVENKVNMSISDQQLIQSALDNSKYILNLSNDLLDLAQIKAGKFKINVQNFNLKNILKECLNMFEIQALKKNIQLNFYFDKQISYDIYSDCNRIRQITINLIGNAMKFTLEGSITLRAYQDGLTDIFIEVKDTGVGMRDEDQPKLIKAFSKIENKETSQLNAQGVGLGLLISNSIATQLNDEQKGLGFHSIYQMGTTFCFLITNRKSPNVDEQENCYDSNREVDLEIKINDVRRQSTQEKKFIIQKLLCSCPQILLVDDNQFNIDSLMLVMQRTFKLNIQLDYTISGQLAEQKVQQRFAKQGHKCHPYKIIFMDVEMPQQNGIVTSKNIKNFYRTMNTSIIIIGCSGYVSDEERLKCLEIMDDYITKPVRKIELERVMNTYFFA